MSSQPIGRHGLLSSFVVLLAGSAVMAAFPDGATTPAALLQEKQEKSEKKGSEPQTQAEKKQAMADQKKAQITELKRAKVQGGSKARGGGVNHDAEMVSARYGGDVEPNAKLDVEFGTEIHNFGPVIQGELLEHTFKMKAGGTKDLVVRQAKPTCGCTVSQVMIESEPGKFEVYQMGDPIKPGQSMKITAAMDTKNKTNKAEVRINVYTNDPTGLYSLGLAAQVEPFMTAAPSYLNLGDLGEDSVREEKITVRTSRGQKILLSFDETSPRPRPAGMAFNLVPVKPDESGKSNHWEVLITVGPGLTEGPMGYAMRLVSDIEVVGGKKAEKHSADDGHGHGAEPAADAKPSYYQVSANVGGRVLGVLSVSPQYLSMGLVRPGQPVSRSVRIVSNDPSIELGSIKARIQGAAGGEFPWSGHFTPIIRPIEGQSQAIEIELRLDGLPEGSEGSFKGEMVLETGNEAKPEMKVTFSGVCRAGVGRSTRTGGN